MHEVLKKLADGKISVDEAELALKTHTVTKVSDFARLDVGRDSRRGIPEIILAEGKSREQLIQIVEAMVGTAGRAIVSRLSNEQSSDLHARFASHQLKEFTRARSMVIRSKDHPVLRTGGRVGILTAGTVDVGVAEEAVMIAQELGCDTHVEADAGVAGIHRLVEPLKNMLERDVDCLIVVAGREGALPTVVAGLVDVPLIAVPTSSGYGFGGRGKAALMAMLQACSLGLAVVNIDSGIAAGVVAAQIANRVARARESRT